MQLSAGTGRLGDLDVPSNYGDCPALSDQLIGDFELAGDLIGGGADPLPSEL